MYIVDSIVVNSYMTEHVCGVNITIFKNNKGKPDYCFRIDLDSKRSAVGIVGGI